MQNLKETITKSAVQNANTEILLPDYTGFIEVEESEKVYKINQQEIRQNVDLNTQSKNFDFQLTKFGPYTVSFSRNGRSMLFGGRKGHCASLDCQRLSVGMELQLEEDVHDICYLHDDTMFAVAQKQYT